MNNCPALDCAVRENTVDGVVTPKLRAELVRVVCGCVPGWEDLSAEKLLISVLEDGLTNSMYKLKYGDLTVVVRVYGEGSDLVIDRDRDDVVSNILYEHGFGKQIYGKFEGGRVESWLDGVAVSVEQMRMPSTQTLIAQQMAKLHRIDAEMPRQVTLWETMENWLQKAKQVEFESEHEIEVVNSLRLDKLEDEISFLKKLVRQGNSPVVMSHNDLTHGNIIYDESHPTEINFIDFEYTCYNHRGFDIANHFCECCGLDGKWDTFPDRKAQNRFFRSYLAEYFEIEEDRIEPDQLRAFSKEVTPYILCSHLFWGVWGVFMTKHSKIDWDYLTYAHSRLVGGYFPMKEQLLQSPETRHAGIKRRMHL